MLRLLNKYQLRYVNKKAFATIIFSLKDLRADGSVSRIGDAVSGLFVAYVKHPVNVFFYSVKKRYNLAKRNFAKLIIRKVFMTSDKDFKIVSSYQFTRDSDIVIMASKDLTVSEIYAVAESELSIFKELTTSHGKGYAGRRFVSIMGESYECS